MSFITDLCLQDASLFLMEKAHNRPPGESLIQPAPLTETAPARSLAPTANLLTTQGAHAARGRRRRRPKRPKKKKGGKKKRLVFFVFVFGSIYST